MRTRTAVAALAAVLLLAGCAGRDDQALPLPNVPNDPVIQQQLDGYAESFSVSYPDVELPVVPIERLIDGDDWATTIVGCLDEAGFRASVSDGGISAAGVEFDQMQDYELASYICKSRFPVQPALTRLDDAKLEVLYAYYAGPLTDCLERFGVSVDPEPGLTRFVENYGLAGSWDPLERVAELDTGAMTQAVARCPQRPADWTE